MRPILLQGHERSLTQVVFNPDGDLLFSTSKDLVVNVWYSHNGERLGTYDGHVGAVWTVHVNPSSTLLATGSADNTMKLWNVRNGVCLYTWQFPTAVKRVEFSEDGTKLLAVIEQRMGHPGSVDIFSIDENVSEQTSEPALVIPTQDSKATVAGWSFLDRFIIMGHENGGVSQWDTKSGKRLAEAQKHQKGMLVTDLQFSPDRTYFITASKDKTAKIWDASDLSLLKSYVSDTPLNTASITPVKDFVILGGGQEAREVTTTQTRQGKFEARFYHKIFEDEIGRVRGHFGPLNTIAVHPKGTSYASGGEDGYVRIHHFEPGYFDFMYEVERERQRALL